MAAEKKLTLQSFIELFVARVNQPEDRAEAFVRSLFEVIAQGLAKDGFAKIKGFGTFKLVAVNPRESVNVNTGERIQITGHTKVTFTPDSALRDLVNKPFADFSTAILSDDLDVTAFDAIVADETLLNDELEGVAEDKYVEEEVLTVQEEALPTVSEVPPAKSLTPPPFRPELLDSAILSQTEEVSRNSPSPLTVPPDPLGGGEDIVETEVAETPLTIAETSTSMIEEEIEPLRSKWVQVLKLVAILICVSLGVYFIGYYVGKSWAEAESKASQVQTAKPTPAKPLVQPQEKSAVKPMQVTPPVDSVSREPVTPPIEEKPAKLDPTKKYRIVGTLATHTLAEGETLNKIAKRTYGSYDFYRYIIQHNQFDNPDVVPVGTPIKLPRLEEKK